MGVGYAKYKKEVTGKCYKRKQSDSKHPVNVSTDKRWCSVKTFKDKSHPAVGEEY